MALKFPISLLDVFRCSASSFGFGPFLAKHVIMPLSVHIVRFALFAYMESAPMRLTLIPVRDSWYSMHCLRRMPSLKASKEWCSMNDMPSICMLLTFAPNSTRLFSLPLTMGRRYGRSMLTMRCFTSLPKNRSDCWRYTACTAHNRFSCSADRQMQGLYNLRRRSHWKMSLERSFEVFA